MATKTFLLKATTVGEDAGPFTVTDCNGATVATITAAQLLTGIEITVDDTCTFIELQSEGICTNITKVNLIYSKCNEANATAELCKLNSTTFINVFPQPSPCSIATVCVSSLSNTIIGNLYPNSMLGATNCVESLGGTLIGYGY
jgi:hypothetical protein